MSETPLPAEVHVVDDDPVVLRSISRVLDAGGLQPVEWLSSRDFLGTARIAPPACVLLDVRMPEVTGPEVQEELRRRGVTVPVVFLTAHADVPTTVRAMKGGAMDFLLKPIDPVALLAAVRAAIRRSEADATHQARRDAVQSRFETLTPREREVFEQVVRGASNREGAAALGIAENTVKVHRVRVMTKMEAGSVADLVQMAVLLGLPADGSGS